jgi:hypothetical protein
MGAPRPAFSANARARSLPSEDVARTMIAIGAQRVRTLFAARQGAVRDFGAALERNFRGSRRRSPWAAS